MAASTSSWARSILAALAALGCTRTPAPTPPVDAQANVAHAAAASPETPTTDAPAHDAGTDTGADAGARARRVTLSVTSDLILSPNLLARADGSLATMVGTVASLLPQQAIALGDLRGPLVTRATRQGPRVFAARVAVAREVVRLGYDAVLVANDHSLDQGAAGLAETTDALRSAGVHPLGAGNDAEAVWAPQIVERNGLRVAVLGFTQRVAAEAGRDDTAVHLARLGDDPAPAVSAVTRARDGVDLVAVLVHGMRLREGRPTDAPRALVRALVDAGADLVAGTGNPAMALVERMPSPRGEAVVAWSLGTMVSGQGLGWHLGTSPAQVAASPYVYDPHLRDAVVLHCRFDLSEPSSVRVTGLTANALWTTLEGGSPRAVLLRNADPRVVAPRQQAVSAALGPAVRVRP